MNESGPHRRPVTDKRRSRAWLLVAAGAIAILVAGYASTFVVSYGEIFQTREPLVATDVSRVSQARVNRIESIQSVDDIRAALDDAARSGLKVSIAGRRHSQGGQTFADDAVVLDMRGFNAVLSVDADAMTVTVESGATWDQIQEALAPRGLALKVMQSSNVFTVGGSLSANAHGRDIDITQIAEVVDRFGLMLADGSIVEVSRESQPELFSLVIGGYGLYGVILDVTLRVTRDEIYEQHASVIDYAEFPDYFKQVVQQDPEVRLMIARPSISADPGSFLRDLVVVTWRYEGLPEPRASELTDEQHVLRDKFFFGLSRRFDWAKSFRWRLQMRHEPTLADSVLVSRNNAMRPPTTPFEFLDYYSKQDSDILQEYFVPVGEFVPFMDEIRALLTGMDANVLSATIRYVSPYDSPELAYAPSHESFAVVLLLNVGLAESAQAATESMTRQLVDAALRHDGSYYLTYQLYPSANQLLRAYPLAAHAFERKRFYDPNETFVNQFYQRYRDALARNTESF